MKINFMFARPFAAALLFAVAGTVVAKEYVTEVDEYYNEDSDNGCCSDTPLNCHRPNLKIRAGVIPVIFADPGHFGVVGINTNVNPNTLVFAETDASYKFKDFFKEPGWIVAGEIGFAVTDRNECFLEFNYAQNKGRSEFDVTGIAFPVVPARTVRFDVEDYKNFGAFLGHRMYFGRMGGSRFDFFLGSKIGLNHRNRVDSGLAVGNVVEPITDTSLNVLFVKDTVVAGGLQLGFDFCVWNNMKIMVVGEVVASGALRTNPAGLLTTNAAIIPANTRVVAPQSGTLVTFPVTAGLVWQF